MTKAEASLIMLTWIHFKCEGCGRACIGEPVSNQMFSYRWCEPCAKIWKKSAYLSHKRYRLPLQGSE